MAKEISKHWTPEQEARAQRLITGSHNFYAIQSLTMSLRDLLKYDHRTRAGRRAKAQARLRLATATDGDLEEMAELRFFIFGEKTAGTIAEALEELKEHRARVREEGFKRSELECP